MRQSTKEIGKFGEDLAEKYLKKRFWHILSRNYLARGGEIDIIACRFGVLAFFEVKTRTNDLFGRPRDAVDGEKIKNIRFVAKNFLNTYCDGGKVKVNYPFGLQKETKIRKKRIDVIEVYLSDCGTSYKINHIKDWENRYELH